MITIAHVESVATGLPAVTNLLAAALVVTAVLVVWRRDLRAIVLLLAVQGAVVASLPLAYGFGLHASELVVMGAALLLRAAALPLILARAVAAHSGPRRETTPLVGTAGSLLICAVLIVVAFAVTAPLLALEPSAASVRAVPAAWAVLLIALLTMAARRQALSQAVGYLMLDNSITATAFLLTGGVPLVVELGVSLDLFFVVIILGLLVPRMRGAFGDSDVGRLRELRD